MRILLALVVLFFFLSPSFSLGGRALGPNPVFRAAANGALWGFATASAMWC